MSRRRISSARRQSRRRSSSDPGELEEDSNVFGEDDPFWYKRIEGNNTGHRNSLQLESSTVLDSGSDVDMPPPQGSWWKPLGKFNQTVNQAFAVRRTIHSSVNAVPTAEGATLYEDSVDSLPEKDSRKKKKYFFLGLPKRESLGDNAFLNVLNESVTTVISDPGPSKRRKSIPNTSFLSDEDSFKQTKNLRTRKSRPALFAKIRTTQSESNNNVFNNLLENVSSNSESLIPTAIKKQQARTFNELQKSGVQNTRGNEPSQGAGPLINSKIRSKDIEQNHDSDPNLSQNVNEKQRIIRNSSKTAHTSISFNSKAKTSFTEERKGNSTFESNSSDVEMKKKRPGLFKRTRKSMATNAFDSIFTSEEEATQKVVKLNKSQDRNSSIKSLEKDHEEKENRANLSESQNNRLTPVEESKNLSSKLEEREGLFKSSSQIDVEYKNDESTTSNTEKNLQSSSRNRKSRPSSQIRNASQNNPQKIFHNIPVASVSRSKRTSKSLDSEEEEDLVSVGRQGIVDQSKRNSSLSISRKRNSSINKSSSTSRNLDSSRRSSRLNESIKVPDTLSTFAEQPQYESTRKIDVPKSGKSQELRRVSRLDSDINEDRSKELTSGELTTEELSTGKSTSLDHSRNVSSRKTFEDEEASDIEVFDPKNNNSRNISASSAEKRKSRSQYESTRKIEVSKSRNSQSRRVPKLDSASIQDHSEDLTVNKSTEEFSSNVFSNKKTFDYETSDIDVSDPKNVISTEENINESKHSKSKNNNDVTRSDERSGDFPNTQREKEKIVDSQRSHTISLSEGGSIRSEVLSENALPLNNTWQSNNQSTERSTNNRYGTSFIPSYSSSDEENSEEKNSSNKKTAKPIITGYEILKANDIDIRKLKGIRKVSKENNASIFSRSQSAIRNIPALNSVENSSIFTNDPQMLGVEEEFKRLHGEENSEIASTTHEYSDVCRNLFTKGVDNETANETLNNKSSSDLRKILEDVDENESEVSQTLLLLYSKNLNEENEESSPAKDLQRKIPSVSKKYFREYKQKMIDDYFKCRDAEKTEGKSQSQRITFAKAAGDKNLMANNKKQLEAIIAPIKQELFKKPKEPEAPKKKLFIAKGTSKKKQSKPVDSAYLVNGVVYKPPKLPRPKHWATDHLYKFIWKKIEPKYKGKTRIRSEKFVLRLTEVFNTVMKRTLYKNYVDDLNSLIEEMARLRLIVNRKDFNDFCNEFMPYEFRVKATPILLPGNKMSIPYDPEKFYAPVLRDDSSVGN